MIKPLITTALLLFVAAAVGVMIFRGKAAPASPPPPPGSMATTSATTAPATIAPATTKLVAFYVHGTQRCNNCRKMEAFTRAALQSAFADDLSAGRMEFRSLNRDEPANAHVINDFQLTMNAVVIAEERGGTVVRWSNLDQVWDRLGDEADFKAYIQSGVKGFRAAGTP